MLHYYAGFTSLIRLSRWMNCHSPESRSRQLSPFGLLVYYTDNNVSNTFTAIEVP
jgi:hypothetical protein